jgi:MFS family permease
LSPEVLNIARPKIFYGYIVTAAGFIIQALAFGTLNTFGVFFTPLLDEFGWSRATLSLASSLSLVMFGLFCIVAGRFGDRFDTRRVMLVFGALLGIGYLLMSRMNSLVELYLFYGLMAGIGLGAMDVVPLSTIARWFISRRGLMSGVIKVGGGLGMLVMPLVAVWLISTYSWRPAYLILGLITLVTIVALSQFLVRDPFRKGLRPLGETDQERNDNGDGNGKAEAALPLRRLLANRQFALIIAIYALTFFGSQTLLVHVAPYAVDLGMSHAEGALILSMFGAVGIASRMTMGILSDRKGNRWALVVCALVYVFAFIWLQWAGSLVTLIVFMAALGFAHGGFFTVLSPLVADLFGLGAHGVNFGIVMFCGTIGGAIGPLIAGHAFDTTGSYQLPFLICAVTSVAVLALSLVLKRSARSFATPVAGH